ncbi:hypothetical protein YTPLAS18_18850 [Nitrospira sp.]|nr:hypothetical protein YTPLAS18_18850 [Nitrospira sp.]
MLASEPVARTLMHNIELRRIASFAAMVLLIGFLMGGCRSPLPSLPEGPIEPILPPGLGVDPVVSRLSRHAAPLIESNIGTQHKATLLSLSGARTYPAIGKRRDAVNTLLDPWEGMNQLEAYALLVAALSKHGTAGLDDVLLTLEKYRIKSGHAPVALPDHRDKRALPQDRLAAALQEVYRLCQRATRTLSPEDRQFLFEHSSRFIDNYRPQSTEPDSQARFLLYTNRRFVQLSQEFVGYDPLVTAAQLATKLADLDLLRELTDSLRTTAPVKKNVDGVKGEILLQKETPAGLIVVGGPGSNTYQLDGRIALLIDLGGDDTYRGLIAAPNTSDQRVNIVIDLSGNDAYLPSSHLALATGRLGVSLLIDKSGNDTYELPDGSGGTGFAGIGILYDEGGNDLYTGGRFTQGASIAGLGLLLDAEGDDQYQSAGYALGFGGPSGVGAIVDLDGDDNYQCGGKIPSLYNLTEVPDGDPNSPLFQFDCFGLGAGAGARVVSSNQDDLGYALAGGIGMAIDLRGDDHYQSANFSQGLGYFFGIGMKLDLEGNDDHLAARYGIASGAHFGVGVFLDYQGADYYDSTGPHYNGAAAWDLGVVLGIDAGRDDDTYSFEHSDGLGIADHNSWSVFIEEGGRDRYHIPRGLGYAEEGGAAAFLDLQGSDYYARTYPNGSARRSNAQSVIDGPGALFVDR